MYILETSALSEKEALKFSSVYLDTKENNIKVKIHKKNSSGFLGMGQKKPNIYHVFYKDEKELSMSVIIKGITSTLIHKMGLEGDVVSIKEKENNKMLVELSSPFSSYIIGREGKTIEVLQSLLNIMIERTTQKHIRIILDIDSYRDRRAQSLCKHAEILVKKAIQTGVVQYLKPLNPFERRIIHLHLEETKDIQVESIGETIHKQMKIIPLNVSNSVEESIGDVSSMKAADDDHVTDNNNDTQTTEGYDMQNMDDIYEAQKQQGNEDMLNTED